MAQQLRRTQISEFSAWLRTQTNRDKRPFQEETIRGYAETARALDLRMAEEDIDGDFAACSVDGGGKVTSSVDARDHAMIRMLTEGVRGEELAQQEITDLSGDLITRPFVRVVPPKGAGPAQGGRSRSRGPREFSEGGDWCRS